jgi:putative membrane protein
MSVDNPEPASGELVDATRRTHLANERTYLAWWRSALTALAVAIATGRIAPNLSGGAEWPYHVLGAAFGVLGIAVACFAFVRHRNVDRALAGGRYAPMDERLAFMLAAATVALALATVVLVLAGG